MHASQQSSHANPRLAPQVLLVEDEPALAHVLERILTSAGLRVIPCASGAAALGILTSDESDVDVMISDVRLPDLSGDDLARTAARLLPRLRLVLMTGFSETVTPENAAVLGVDAILQKPVSAHHLVDTVYRALASVDRSVAT